MGTGGSVQARGRSPSPAFFQGGDRPQTPVLGVFPGEDLSFPPILQAGDRRPERGERRLALQRRPPEPPRAVVPLLLRALLLFLF